jgi:hypothetical protein
MTKRANTGAEKVAAVSRSQHDRTVLRQFAQQANEAHARGVNKLKGTLEEFFCAGDALLQADAELKHGELLPWIKTNCNFSVRTGQLYMQLARNQAAIRAKCATVAHLTVRDALNLITPTRGWPPREGQEYIGPWPPRGMAIPPPKAKGGIDADHQAWIDGQIDKQERIAAEARRLQDEAATAAEEARRKQAAEQAEQDAAIAKKARRARELAAKLAAEQAEREAAEERRYQAWLEARALFSGRREPTQSVNILLVSNEPTKTVVIPPPDAPPPDWEVDDSQPAEIGRIYLLKLGDDFQAEVRRSSTGWQWLVLTPDDELAGEAPDLAIALADSEAILRAAAHNFERDQIKRAAEQFDQVVTNARMKGVLGEADNDLFEAARLTQVWRLKARALDRAAAGLSNGQNRPVWSTPVLTEITDPEMIERIRREAEQSAPAAAKSAQWPQLDPDSDPDATVH